MENQNTKHIFSLIYMEETLNFFAENNIHFDIINEVINKFQSKKTEKGRVPYFVITKKYNNEKDS
jgi:prolyl oligopeptidase PreP (S9A serine peptidase family)